MAQGDSGITALSLRRLTLFKELQDIYNTSSFLGLHATADSATQLATARKIDGITFNGTADIHHFTYCQSAASDVAKICSINGYNKVAGARIYVLFTNTSTVGNNTLNVNNSGAHLIKYLGNNISAGDLIANGIYEFIYDGQYYQLAGCTKMKYVEFEPSTQYSAGAKGLVPGPAIGDDSEMFLTAACTWRIPSNYHQTSHTYALGEIVHVTSFPSNYCLQATTSGTTASTRAAINNYLNS